MKILAVADHKDPLVYSPNIKTALRMLIWYWERETCPWSTTVL